MRTLAAAIGHRDAILRFGRFPHRNAVLGRDSTPEEAEYLKEPPSWGLTAEEFAEWEREKAEREGEFKPSTFCRARRIATSLRALSDENGLMGRWGIHSCQVRNPFHYFNSSSEVIGLAVMRA